MATHMQFDLNGFDLPGRYSPEFNSPVPAGARDVGRWADEHNLGWVYGIVCAERCLYIGKTTNPIFRYYQHANGFYLAREKLQPGFLFAESVDKKADQMLLPLADSDFSWRNSNLLDFYLSYALCVSSLTYRLLLQCDRSELAAAERVYIRHYRKLGEPLANVQGCCA